MPSIGTVPNDAVRLLLAPKFRGFGDSVGRMSEQICLRLVHRRHRLHRRARHNNVGTTTKVEPQRLVCCSQAQPLPFLRPPDCGKDRLLRYDTHTALGRKKRSSGEPGGLPRTAPVARLRAAGVDAFRSFRCDGRAFPLYLRFRGLSKFHPGEKALERTFQRR
jgi:hypothetical protein